MLKRESGKWKKKAKEKRNGMWLNTSKGKRDDKKTVGKRGKIKKMLKIKGEKKERK